MTTPTSQAPTLADALGGAIGHEKLVTDVGDLADYGGGKSPFRGLTPRIAVKVTSADDIAAVLRIAGERSTPVVARGGGFSIAGAPSRPDDEPIVVDMRALDRIVEIDEESMTVTAECGVIMADLEAAVAERGFEVHTVAVPRAYTTLGGVLSGIFGGGFPSDVAAIGSSGRHVMGLRVVLPNGSILDTNAGGSNVNRRVASAHGSDGPHLTQLFVGDGGALGVKVLATLAIHPARTKVKAGAYAFDSFERAWGAVTELNRVADEVPYAKLYVQRGSGSSWGLTYAAKAGSEERLADHVAMLDRTIERHGGVPGDKELLEYAQHNADMDPAWTNQFLELERGVIALVFGNRDFPEAFARMRELVEVRFAERLRTLNVEPIVFASPYGRHATWFAISLPYDKGMAGTRDEMVEMTKAGAELAMSLGGYNEAHQGEITTLLAEGWSPEFRAMFELLKHGVDPQGILNTGLWGEG